MSTKPLYLWKTDVHTSLSTVGDGWSVCSNFHVNPRVLFRCECLWWQRECETYESTFLSIGAQHVFTSFFPPSSYLLCPSLSHSECLSAVAFRALNAGQQSTAMRDRGKQHSTPSTRETGRNHAALPAWVTVDQVLRHCKCYDVVDDIMLTCLSDVVSRCTFLDVFFCIMTSHCPMSYCETLMTEPLMKMPWSILSTNLSRHR